VGNGENVRGQERENERENLYYMQVLKSIKQPAVYLFYLNSTNALLIKAEGYGIIKSG